MSLIVFGALILCACENKKAQNDVRTGNDHIAAMVEQQVWLSNAELSDARIYTMSESELIEARGHVDAFLKAAKNVLFYASQDGVKFENNHEASIQGIKIRISVYEEVASKLERRLNQIRGLAPEPQHRYDHPKHGHRRILRDHENEENSQRIAI